MKKLFVALMAVLVLASCGGKKETPADVMMMTVELMNNTAANIEKATTADEVIDATADLYSQFEEIKTKYGEVMLAVDTLSDDQLKELYPTEMEAMEEASISFATAMMGKSDLMENLTPEQEARLMEVLGMEL